MTPRTAIKLLPVFTATLWLAACATAEAGPSDPPRRVAEACTQIMGLRIGETHFDECAGSLADTLARKATQAAALQNAEACDETQRGSPQFSFCLLRREDAQSVPLPEDATPLAIDLPRKSFFVLSPEETAAREKFACAALGIDADGALFSSCVGHLDTALDDESLQ